MVCLNLNLFVVLKPGQVGERIGNMLVRVPPKVPSRFRLVKLRDTLKKLRQDGRQRTRTHVPTHC